jgi:polysaccharide pyruvyl transferase WcaK-like protein
LIPHVVCSFAENDDDLEYLRQVSAQLPPDIRCRVHLIDNDPGFLGAKDILRTCDLVVSARMHCGINAVSEGVPTIFLAYSAKAYGMAEYIYGDAAWALPLSQFTPQRIIPVIERVTGARREVSIRLARRLQEIQQDAYRAIVALQSLLPQEGSPAVRTNISQTDHYRSMVALGGTSAPPDPRNVLPIHAREGTE